MNGDWKRNNKEAAYDLNGFGRHEAHYRILKYIEGSTAATAAEERKKNTDPGQCGYSFFAVLEWFGVRVRSLGIGYCTNMYGGNRPQSVTPGNSATWVNYG